MFLPLGVEVSAIKSFTSGLYRDRTGSLLKGYQAVHGSFDHGLCGICDGGP